MSKREKRKDKSSESKKEKITKRKNLMSISF